MLARFMTNFAAGYPRLQPWEECRLSFQQHFQFLTAQQEERGVGLRHSGSPERDGSAYTVPYQPPMRGARLNGRGSRQEHRAWVKRSRSIFMKLRFISHASDSACWVRTGTLSMCPDASDCEAKAADP